MAEIAWTHETLIFPGAYTEVGSPTFVDDFCNSNAALLCDGVDNALDFGSSLVSNGDGDKQTINCWLNVPDLNSESGSSHVFGQSTTGNQSINVFVRAGVAQQGIVEITFSSVANTSNSLTYVSTTRIDTATDVHLSITVDGATDTINLRIDDVDDAQSTVKNGTGWSGPAVSIPDFTIGAREDGSLPSKNLIEIFRIKVKNNGAASDADRTEEYNAELACQNGDGEGVPESVLLLLT